jgi:hypothetical protein
MDAIIQTLTLATILLFIGLTCIVIGIAGLVWRMGRDERRRNSAEAARTSADSVRLTLPLSRSGSANVTHRAGHAYSSQEAVVSSRLPGHR